MRFLPLLLVVWYKSLIMIRASPILSIGAYPSGLVASPFVPERRSRVALSAVHIADTGGLESENQGSTELVGGGTISQQKQPQNQPADLTPCTMLLGEVRQPDTLNTDSTPFTGSTISYGHMNDGTVLNAVASPTTTQEASSSVVGMSSPSVVAPILSDMDPTSTFSMATGTAWVTPSVSLTGNDANRYEDTPPGRPPNPTATMRAEMQCSQKRATASKFGRQAPGDPSCGPDGPPPDRSASGGPPPNGPPPNGPPPNGPPPNGPPSGGPPPDGPPYTPSESPCSSSSVTGTNTSPTTNTSNPVPSDRLPPLPPLLQWYQCGVVTIFMVVGCVYSVRRKKARPKMEYCCHEDAPGAFDGCGRTCGLKDSRLPEWLRNLVVMSRLLRVKPPRGRQTILAPETP